MTNEEEDAEFLAHYGVKGMKWDKHNKYKDADAARDEALRKDAIKNGGNDTYGPDGTKRGFLDSESTTSTLKKGKWDTISKTETQGKIGRFIDSFFDKSVTRRIPKKGNVTTVEKGRINKFLAKNFATESTSSSSSWTTDSKTSTGSSGRSLTKDYRFDRKSPRLNLTIKNKDKSWSKD